MYIKEQYLQLKQNLIPLRDHIVCINLYHAFCDARGIIEKCETKCGRVLGSQQAYDRVLRRLIELGYLVYRYNDDCIISLNQLADLALSKYYDLCITYKSMLEYNNTNIQKRRWYHRYLGMYIGVKIDPEVSNYEITINQVKWKVKDVRLGRYIKVTL